MHVGRRSEILIAACKIYTYLYQSRWGVPASASRPMSFHFTRGDAGTPPATLDPRRCNTISMSAIIACTMVAILLSFSSGLNLSSMWGAPLAKSYSKIGSSLKGFVRSDFPASFAYNESVSTIYSHLS